MPIRYISKGKGKNRKTFPIRPKKKGVSVRTVSLQPSAVVKVNKEQIKLLNRGETTTFSKALNRVIIRAKREIPIYDTHVNTNNRRKPYQMFVTDMKKHKKVKGTDTIVMADNYGQAVDDFITVWNKDPERMKNPIGYPVVQGTADRSFRYARVSSGLIIEKDFVTATGRMNSKLFLKNNKWDNLTEHQRGLTLETLGLENEHSRMQLAKRDFDDLTDFWKKELKKEGFKDQ